MNMQVAAEAMEKPGLVMAIEDLVETGSAVCEV